MKRFFAFFLVPVLSFAVCSNTQVVGLRTDINAPNVPFVAGQLAPEFKNAQYFNPEIVKIGERCADIIIIIIIKQVYGK